MEADFNPMATTKTGAALHQAAMQREARRLRDQHAKAWRRAIGQQVDLAANAIAAGLDGTASVVTGPVMEAYARILSPVILQAARATYLQGEQLYARSIMPELLSAWQEMLVQFLSTEGAARVVQITAATRAMVRELLRDAAAERWGPVEAARQLRKRWVSLSRARSERIARTELLGGLNRGAQMGAEAIAARYGLTMQKEWLWSGISRQSHADANGQRVGLNEPFLVGGEYLMYPGDQAASAFNVINCGCTVIYVPRDPLLQ